MDVQKDKHALTFVAGMCLCEPPLQMGEGHVEQVARNLMTTAVPVEEFEFQVTAGP